MLRRLAQLLLAHVVARRVLDAHVDRLRWQVQWEVYCRWLDNLAALERGLVEVASESVVPRVRQHFLFAHHGHINVLERGLLHILRPSDRLRLLSGLVIPGTHTELSLTT